jgi:hypothetical protein
MKDVDRAVADLLRSQYGVVARGQLLHAGMTRRQIAWRCETGEWVANHRGVYRSAAFPFLFEQRLMAALLAAGPAAVASHASAAWLWGLGTSPPERPSLTVPVPRHPRVAGADVYRVNDLDNRRVRLWRNFKCTDPLRTLVDYAAVASRQDLANAVDTALSTNLVTVRAISSELERRAIRGRRGVRPLRTLLDDRGMTGGHTPSALEAATLSMLGRWKIPVRGREARTGPDGRYRLDISLAPRVAVEVDGFAFHWSPEAKAYDEARRNQLRLDGIFLLVYTWRDIHFDEERVAHEVMAALSRYAGAAPGGIPSRAPPVLTSAVGYQPGKRAAAPRVRTGSSVTCPPTIL